MNEKVYVNGAIIVLTPFFKFEKGGAKHPIPPIGAEIIEPNDIKSFKEPCLIITEEKAPSFFKEYYAKSFFSVKGLRAPFFNETLEDCFNQFKDRESQILKFLNISDNSTESIELIFQSSIMLIVSALDTLISDIILFIATKNRDSFIEIIDLVGGNKKNNLYKRVIRMWCDNTIDSAEQDVIDEVLKKSYANQKEIITILNKLYYVSITENDELKKILHFRHLIVHRHGRQKDGTYLTFSLQDIKGHIKTIHRFVEHIEERIMTSPILNKLPSYYVHESTDTDSP